MLPAAELQCSVQKDKQTAEND